MRRCAAETSFGGLHLTLRSQNFLQVSFSVLAVTGQDLFGFDGYTVFSALILHVMPLCYRILHVLNSYT